MKFKASFLALIVLLLSTVWAPLSAVITIRHEFQYTGGGSCPGGDLLPVGADFYGLASEGGKYNQGTIFRLKADGSGYTILHNFGDRLEDGHWPNGSLIESGGALYGMTSGGGSNYNGTIFRINPDGGGYTLLHSFTGGTGDGSSPKGSLIESGGALYGMTLYGGAGGKGTIFKMNTDGSGFTLLHSFTGAPGDGSGPTGSLIELGGALYGLTYSVGSAGPSNEYGTVFKMNFDGGNFTLLYSFVGAPWDGGSPANSLIASGGAIYGMTYKGGAGGIGAIFKMNPDGSGFSLLHSFAGGASDGHSPWGSLIELGGTLYGLTRYGGADGKGAIFKMNPDGGGFALLHSFAGGSGDGREPLGSLISSGGAIYGMTKNGGAGSTGSSWGFGTVFKINPDGGGFTLLYSFAGGAGNGSSPRGSLIASGGALYATTNNGGLSDKGTLFKMNPDGRGFSLLRSFAGGTEDGSYPGDSLIEWGGALYGLTNRGGAGSSSTSWGSGTVFKMNPDGSGFSLLHSFAGGTEDGSWPNGSLIESGGALYGLTSAGGGAGSYGTVFKVNPDGSGYTLLHSFTGGTGDGSRPNGSLIESGGALYGLTREGGVSGCGTIFKINPDGSGFSLLHSFPGFPGEGGWPEGSLIESGGALYGLTRAGGANGYGTIFKINPDGGGFTLLHSFTGAPGDGSQPDGSLIESGGALYGTTNNGGLSDKGTIFKINPDGSGFALLHSFAGGTGDGCWPKGSLTESGGALYGTTEAGGEANLGVIFSLPLSITVTSPNGGENWIGGSNYNMTWITTGTAAKVKLEYSINNGTNWTTIIASTANADSYAWTIPVVVSANCLVRVSEASTGTPTDISNAVFAITAAGVPTIGLSKTSLNFGSERYGTPTPAETVILTNGGTGSLNWTAAPTVDWISVLPGSGSGSGELTISVSRTDMSPGYYPGAIAISDPNASNSPQTITVGFNVLPVGTDSPPFGNFETPLDGSMAASSIPVTGWALDDIGMQSVKIYRGMGLSDRVYIGDAVFSKGARPDVEAAYPVYPQNDRAGWGYMLLTNFLPSGGNGTFQLLAYATDTGGHEVLLGSKTITCDNLNAVKPFGAIDTPFQGGTASGSSYVDFGWALTPQPNSIQIDGSTLTVFVDGLPLGHPTYNNYRADIATLFPGYVNSNGAVGYYYLDTTAYADGVHTIAWLVTDSGGNADGIGSRYFTIQNMAGKPGLNESEAENIGRTGTNEKALSLSTQSPSRESMDVSSWRKSRFPAPGTGRGFAALLSTATSHEGAQTPAVNSSHGRKPVELQQNLGIRSVAEITGIPEDRQTPVYIKRGYRDDQLMETVFPETDGSIRIQIPEVSRVAIYLDPTQAWETREELEARGKELLGKNGFRSGKSGINIAPGKNDYRLDKPAGNSTVEANLARRPGIAPNIPPYPSSVPAVNPRYSVFLLVGSELRPLPIGSTFDAERGVLYWQPGPGFLGDFNFILVDGCQNSKKAVRVRIGPKEKTPSRINH